VPLAPLTTLKIGGSARCLAVIDNEVTIAEAFEFAEKKSLNLLVLGGGSNVLISDAGFDGLVLCIALRGISSVDKDNDVASLTVCAGEHWDDLVRFCVENDLAGVECLSGIPGFVGGTPIQNVGAYGQEVSETITSVRCFDRKTNDFVTLGNSDCKFSYRTSIFNSTERDRYIVSSVTFELRRGGEPKIVYKDLIEHFEGRRPSLGEVRNTVLKIRRSKSMVIDVDDPNSKSAGSFFKNPVVEKPRFEELKAHNAGMPFFPFGDQIKIPAAWLIENAGFHKGFALGNAGISANHTLALINRGDATAGDMLALEQEIQDAVEAKFGIVLQPEPVFVGF